MNKNNYYSTDYLELKKSPLTPPNYVFGIVWPILYTMMGISALLVFNKCNKLCLPLVVFMIHLFFNLIWTYLFINIKNKLIALVDLFAVLTLAIYCLIEFRKYSVLASNLLVPYVLWLSFAGYLNIYIVLNNSNNSK